MALWRALFQDNSTLNQYDDQGRIIQFGKVKERFNELKAFSIRLQDENVYMVSMVDGMFTIRGMCIYMLDTKIYPSEKLENIRPIYFERCQADFGTNGQPTRQARLFTAIGFQAIFEGRNVKRYLEVYDSGDCKVREK